MNKKLKLSLLALLTTIATMPVHAQISRHPPVYPVAAPTNLMQSVSVAFEYYWHGPTNITATTTNYTVSKSSFGTKQLISILSSNGFKNGDVLVRVTPITNVAVITTNLVPVDTNILMITNTSTTLAAVSNELIFNGGTATNIGDTNYSFGTNIEDINGTAVTISNYITYGTSNVFIGTNTTVTTTTLTDSNGYNVGFSNVFVINAFSNVLGGTNKLGTPYWAIYNPNTSPKLAPIATNVSFAIHTDQVYDDGTNLALMHGENIIKNGVIQYGTTDEIRTLLLSNSDWNIKLDGYSNGHYVPVSLGTNGTVYSQDYTWTGSGSGVISNSVPIVIHGGVSEQFIKVRD